MNESLAASDAAALYELLSKPESKFENLRAENSEHYYNSLKRFRDSNPEVNADTVCIYNLIYRLTLHPLLLSECDYNWNLSFHC